MMHLNSPRFNVISSAILLVVLTISTTALLTSCYEDNIKFVFFNERMQLGTSNDSNIVCTNGTQQKLAVVVHGWLEDCKKMWVTNLTRNLKVHRQGCIVCMDYSHYSKKINYTELRQNFDGIATVLTNKLNDFSRLSFEPNNIYLFGFSFGAHVVLEAGRRFANYCPHKLIKQIDVCNPTGQMGSRSPREAAQNVQCIHTDIKLGTFTRDCHQNWNMGECGNAQVAAGRFFDNSSHGLCPAFYNSAFEHTFPAITKPNNCRSVRAASGSDLKDLSMGYLDALKHEGRFPQGKDFFANTYKKYPFSQSTDETANKQHHKGQ